MRLLVLTTSFPSSAYPASGIYIQRMLRKLPVKIRTTVLSPACDRRIEPPCGPRNIQVKFIRYAPRCWQVLSHRPGGIPAAVRGQSWAWALTPIFSAAILFSTLRHARRADLIHAHWSFCGLIAGVAGRWLGVPVITTLHGSDVRWAAKSLFLKKILQWCVALNDRVVTVGQDLADQARQWVLPAGRNKIAVIANGVDLTLGTLRDRPASGVTVTVIGNLIALKQVDVVLRAFATLVGIDDRLRLVIVGAGPELERLKYLARRLSIAERVKFAGQLPPEAAAGHLARSDMLVLASVGEGQSSVVMEAMAAGVPVVASRIAGVRELIADGERGLLFPAGDVARLADCMRRIIENPDDGRRLAANAARWIRDRKLTWEETAGRYAELYSQVTREFRHRSRKSSWAG